MVCIIRYRIDCDRRLGMVNKLIEIVIFYASDMSKEKLLEFYQWGSAKLIQRMTKRESENF